MNVWLAFFRERVNPFLSLPVILGIALSSSVLGGNLFQPIPFFLSSILLIFITFLFRLRNDVKDYEKDRIAFPNRPLPRKLLSRKVAEEVVKYLQYCLIVFFVFLFILFGGPTRTYLLISMIYLWMILNDFFVAGNWLKRRPLIKASIEQGFIFILTLFTISLGRPFLAGTSQGLSYALVTFSAFFTYELCRKLDPYSHPITLTYVHYYGLKKVLSVVSFLLLLSAVGAYSLGLLPWLFPCEALVFASLFLLLLWPKQYRLAEMAAAFSLILHTWAGPLQHFAMQTIWT